VGLLLFDHDAFELLEAVAEVVQVEGEVKAGAADDQDGDDQSLAELGSDGCRDPEDREAGDEAEAAEQGSENAGKGQNFHLIDLFH